MDTAAPQTTPESDVDLRRQVSQLQERLAFYERFDVLIQDNVTHARELLRLAAQERATTAAGGPETDAAPHLRSELEAIARELSVLAGSLDALSQRVAAALESANQAAEAAAWQPQRAAIVVHGVASARSALSLQRFLHDLPQVTSVTAREFAGGVLRLDADLAQPLQAAHLETWDQGSSLQVVTHRPDVLELAMGQRIQPVPLTS